MAQERPVILVTGAAGRIGTGLVARLGHKYRIVGFELLKAIYASPQEELVPVDLASEESVHQAFAHIRSFYGNHITSCVHLAAYYSFAVKESPLYDQITVKGTQRLLNHLQKFEVEQFIFSSTMLVHAPCRPHQKISETWPLQPKWGYPKSKVKTEKIIREKHGDIPTVVLRIAGVYDDYCDSIPIAQQIQRIYEHQLMAHLYTGRLSHGASYVHLDDVVDAIALAVEKRASLPKETTMLIGEPKTLSYGHLQNRISKLCRGKPIRTFRLPRWLGMVGAVIFSLFTPKSKRFVRPWMIPLADDNYTLNIAKAKKVLGWSPKRSLEETLPKMIEHLREGEEEWYKRNNLVR
jgi:nucleoside-diphosphate-sugar epimerase